MEEYLFYVNRYDMLTVNVESDGTLISLSFPESDILGGFHKYRNENGTMYAINPEEMLEEIKVDEMLTILQSEHLDCDFFDNFIKKYNLKEFVW